jgi:hypothetical protein
MSALNYAAWQLALNAIAELRGWTSFVSIQNHITCWSADRAG